LTVLEQSLLYPTSFKGPFQCILNGSAHLGSAIVPPSKAFIATICDSEMQIVIHLAAICDSEMHFVIHWLHFVI
jgi:hypothetical protein